MRSTILTVTSAALTSLALVLAGAGALDTKAYLAPDRGSGLGEMSRGPHKILQNPYDKEKRIWIVDDDMHRIMIFSNDGKLLKTTGERGVPARDANQRK
jgi:hypothetical protein